MIFVYERFVFEFSFLIFPLSLLYPCFTFLVISPFEARAFLYNLVSACLGQLMIHYIPAMCLLFEQTHWSISRRSVTLEILMLVPGKNQHSALVPASGKHKVCIGPININQPVNRICH